MDNITVESLIEASAHPITGAKEDYEPLLKQIGNARLVLLGEASHGTHEFYRARAEITKRLIAEKGFSAVAVEADWPDAYRINRYVRADSDDVEAVDALAGFKRFPAWMWRNADVLDFVGWLRDYNDSLDSATTKAGFYGLDLYSLHSSIEAVLHYLDKVDPEAASRARYRYSCFDHFDEDPQSYGYAASFGLAESCENNVVNQLVELQMKAPEFMRRNGQLAMDNFFFAEQNARLVKNAEQYYRLMFHGRISSWNLRDRHMAETLDALMSHLNIQQREAKIVVWEHNSHLGDARATEMGERGEWNVGQLVREKYGAEAVLVGFTTYGGTVTAASDWGGIAERKRVRPALGGSYESLFHKVGLKSFLLNLRDDSKAAASLYTQRLQRAIGVIYRPETERISHYFHARLSEQFDAIIHFDHTRAVEPLERTSHWDGGELPETFPSGV
jgi:erythromycin esterase-like protein